MRQRETEHEQGGAEREGDTESEVGSRLWAVSTEPDAGLELTNCEIMTWAEVRCLTDRATQVPHILSHSNRKLKFYSHRMSNHELFLKAAVFKSFTQHTWHSHRRLQVFWLIPQEKMFLKNCLMWALGWLSRLSVWLLLWSWTHGLCVRVPRPALCWQLRAWSLLQILCLPLSLCPSPTCTLSVSLKNK